MNDAIHEKRVIMIVIGAYRDHIIKIFDIVISISYVARIKNILRSCFFALNVKSMALLKNSRFLTNPPPIITKITDNIPKH